MYYCFRTFSGRNFFGLVSLVRMNHPDLNLNLGSGQKWTRIRKP